MSRALCKATFSERNTFNGHTLNVSDVPSRIVPEKTLVLQSIDKGLCDNSFEPPKRPDTKNLDMNA